MASRADDIERDLADRRARLTRRADDLRASVRDLRSVPQDLLNDSGVKEQIGQRPLTSVGAALTAGVVLGAVTKSSGKPGDKKASGDAKGGPLGGLMGLAEGAAGKQLLGLVKEMLIKPKSDSQPEAAAVNPDSIAAEPREEML